MTTSLDPCLFTLFFLPNPHQPSILLSLNSFARENPLIKYPLNDSMGCCMSTPSPKPRGAPSTRPRTTATRERVQHTYELERWPSPALLATIEAGRVAQGRRMPPSDTSSTLSASTSTGSGNGSRPQRDSSVKDDEDESRMEGEFHVYQMPQKPRRVQVREPQRRWTAPGGLGRSV